ncbi:peptidoglycan recognition protein family protein [Promicromonospora kroppenstedtii]|uniref:peptidoglycan recognition protein family protein n=1 Tax=Promicromonospora kroppenstedtii TaxID=440482 RepID=UPI0006862D37|nr:N-acetylmuramoyl-L-alanine amidase [Promicromonospora kroppenstedtii]
MTEIISRAAWGAKYAPGPYTRKLGHLEQWLHHTVTVAPNVTPPFTDDYAAVRAVEAITESRFGWGMAYTFLVTPAGLIFEGHPIDRVGAHTEGHNTAGAGIAWVGNYDTSEPPAAMVRATAALLRHGKARGWWADVKLDGGHRDTKATACPGKHAYTLIDDINRAAAAAGPVPTPTPPTQNEDYDMDTLDLSNAHKKPVKADDVGKLQGLLLAHGYGPRGLVGRHGRPDRVAGKVTRQLLGKFQAKTGTGSKAGADYIAGGRTWRALIED